MSDRWDEMPTLEQRIEDIGAVLDAVGWERAHMLGTSEGAAMGMLFAADFPERVESLTMINTFIPPRYRDRLETQSRAGDPPWLRVIEVYEHFLEMLETWG